MNKRSISLTLFAVLGALLALAGSAARAAQKNAAEVTKDEFFIISSVDIPKHQLVLKMPTEVTMLMSVSDKTSIVGEKGQRLRPTDLRSGDTVYITYVRSGSQANALSIRIGPMTVEELHRRYLNGYAVPIPPPPAPSYRPQPAKVQRSQKSL